MKRAKRILLGFAALIFLVGLGLIGFLWIDAQNDVDKSGEYVALGSSFAAGPGLGKRATGSPLICMRSAGNYPALLSQKLGLKLVDMSCSGSTTMHILDGGQIFLGPQIAAVGPDTQLVTITSGGNDVNYIGSLMTEAGSLGLFGALSGDPQPIKTLNFDAVTRNLVTIVKRIRQTAPKAQTVILSYQAVAPEKGNCPAMGLSDAAVDRAGKIARRLGEAQRNAATQSGAKFIDLAALTSAHNVCAKIPWMLGANPVDGSAFHPNAAGMEGAAEAIYRALGQSLKDQSSNQGQGGGISEALP